MPLPDERPRQSVANLIGRFEQKRQSASSIVPPVLPRSTSVTSHITGDSAKEEARERREWPPKSVTAGDSPGVSPATSTVLLPAASSLPTSPPISDTVALPVTEHAIEAPIPIPQSPPAADPVELTKSSAAKTPPTRKPTSTTSTQIKAQTTRLSTNTKTPRKSPVHSASKSPPSVQPLRSQNTGTSIKSTKSIPSTPAGAKISKSTTSTPSRAKTPTTSRPKTPGGTPASTSRPKTTSLFAPTAASLARARNAQPPVPTPVKKVTLSSSAAERLSKPTAASSSRVRDPVPAARGGNATGSPARGGSKATVKPRVGLAGVKPKELGSKDGNGTAKVAGAAAAAGVVVDGLEVHADELVENGNHLATSIHSEPQEVEVHEENTHYDVEDLGDISHEVENEGLSREVDPEEHVEDGEASEGRSIVLSPSPTLHENMVEEHAKELETHEDPPSQKGDGDAHEEHAKDDAEAKLQGTDIDDIVNLLEIKRNISLSEPYPVNEERILEDTPDIPDEE